MTPGQPVVKGLMSHTYLGSCWTCLQWPADPACNSVLQTRVYPRDQALQPEPDCSLHAARPPPVQQTEPTSCPHDVLCGRSSISQHWLKSPAAHGPGRL